MTFAPGAMVFPGGRVDPADAALAATLHLKDGGTAVAAVRETIEECAVPVGLNPEPGRAQTLALQQALLSGADFQALLDNAGLTLDCAALTPFARWVPGHEVSRRFDTLFFIARAPRRDLAPHVGSGECESARWISAREALDQEGSGLARLIYPTRKNLERLAKFATFEEILTDARSHPVVPITAWIERNAGEDVVRIPDRLGYPSTIDPLHKVWRG